MKLTDAQIGKEYIVKEIETEDDELDAFLFSLGCYSGQPVTIVRKVHGGYVIAIKDGRYTIDRDLAQAIVVA